MLRQTLKRLLKSKHSWRLSSFDELNELYISMMFRDLALSLTGIFVPIYLISSGYSFAEVCLFYVFFFMSRTVMDILSGHLVGRIGPKHTMLVSYMLQAVNLLLLLTIREVAWPLIAPAVVWGVSNSLFLVAFHTDFSKVKHSAHGGKELGYLIIVERLGSALGPVVAGVVATIFGSQYIFLAAVTLLFIGLVPLFRTAEPTKTRQRVDFKNLPVNSMKPELLSCAGLSIEHNLLTVLWPLFIALYALGSRTYLELGAVSTAGLLVSVSGAYLIGSLVDKGRGKLVLNLAAVATAATSLLRPFVGSLGVALGVNTASAALVPGYYIPYHKGMYDTADEMSGQRIAYIATVEAFASFAKLLVWVELYVLAGLWDTRSVMVIGFIIAAGASLLIMAQRFKSLEYAKKYA